MGTASTRCVIGERTSQGEVIVVGTSSRPSQGMRRGMVVDVEACSVAIKEAFTYGERMAGGRVSAVYVGLSPLYASLQGARGIVAILGEGREVTEDDVERVVKAAKAANLPPNKEVLDVISREYIIDGYGGVLDPLGMVGMRLEMHASLVVGDLTSVSNLRRAVELAGYEIDGLVLTPLALGQLVLNQDERELGVALIDIGSATSEIGYFTDGMLRQVGVVPLGGASITNDLAVILKVSLTVAEKVRRELDLFGGDREGDGVIELELSSFGHIESKRVSFRTLTEIVEARLEEIFQMALKQSAIMTDNHGAPNLVVTGGVANARGIKRVVKRYLPGTTRVSVGTHGYVNDPVFNTAVAILSYVLVSINHKPEDEKSPRKISGGVVSRLAGWLKEFWE